MRSTPPRRPRWPDLVTRTSYQVGRPWMFDGKMLRGETGIPMRRKLLAKSSFAEAEPEPLTLANFTTKSFTASMRAIMIGGWFLVDPFFCWTLLGGFERDGLPAVTSAARTRVRHVEQ